MSIIKSLVSTTIMTDMETTIKSIQKNIILKNKEIKTMKLTFAEKGILRIDDARIVYRNFKGEGGNYNREGDRNFAVVIPDEKLADMLVNDVNEYGVGWNVKINPPREEGDAPFITLKTKLKFNGKGPAIYLRTGKNMNKLDEESICCLDSVNIQRVDLDIRPYDDIINGKPFRAAYVQSMCVTQEVDRFMDQYAEEEFPE